MLGWARSKTGAYRLLGHVRGCKMSERDAIFDRIVFGDIYTDVKVEELYQAFKKRLMAELCASSVFGEGDVTHEHRALLPLVERAKE
jgi:hypothetical protein